MSETTGERRPARHRRLLFWMRVHGTAFVLTTLVLNVVNVIQGAPWWALWPTLIWGVVFAPHFFIVKAITVDEAWVDERALELREHSYDFDHMRDIEKRIVDSDFSVVPRGERQDR